MVQVQVDVMQGGVASGTPGAVFNVTNRLTGRFDPGLLRPFIESDPNSPDRGYACAQLMTRNASTGAWNVPKKYRIDKWRSLGVDSPVFNAVVFTREDWIEIDRSVERARRLRLSAFDSIRARSVKTFDAWNKFTLEYAAQSDAGEVVKSMDATDPGRDDTPTNLIRSLPLPVIHGGCSYPQRLLDAARATGMPLDTEMIEQLTRRGWEMVEKTTIGTETGLTWGGRTTGPFPTTGASTEFGLTNFTYRTTKTDLTVPTGANPEAIKTDVQEMIETLQAAGYFGPYTLFHSTPYSTFVNDDYFRSGSTSAVRTVRERLLELDSIEAILRLDYLTSGYQLILADFGSGQFQAINGMMPRVMQWSERGGLIQKLEVLMIQTVLMKAPASGVAGLVHATTA